MAVLVTKTCCLMPSACLQGMTGNNRFRGLYITKVHGVRGVDVDVVQSIQSCFFSHALHKGVFLLDSSSHGSKTDILNEKLTCTNTVSSKACSQPMRIRKQSPYDDTGRDLKPQQCYIFSDMALQPSRLKNKPPSGVSARVSTRHTRKMHLLKFTSCLRSPGNIRNIASPSNRYIIIPHAYPV